MLIVKVVLAIAGVAAIAVGFVVGERRPLVSMLSPVGVMMLLAALLWITVPGFFN